MVSDYSIYTPEMILKKAEVKPGDILIINTGYHNYSFDQPDVVNASAQGGVESKEFGFLVRHPGPSIEFYKWAMEMKLKVVGVDCGAAEHPMNTPIRRMHDNHFQLAEAKLKKETGKTWDETFPQGEYYNLTHIQMPKAHLVLAECIVGEIDKLKNKRAWICIMPIPYMEVEAAWSRVVAYTAPAGMSDDEFFKAMENSEMVDMTVPFSVQTPQWLNYIPLSVTYTKRVGGQFFGMGRNGSICNASIHLGTHMDGEKHFYPRRAHHRPGAPGRMGWPGRHCRYLPPGQRFQRLHPQDDPRCSRYPQGRHPGHQDWLEQIRLVQSSNRTNSATWSSTRVLHPISPSGRPI